MQKQPAMKSAAAQVLERLQRISAEGGLDTPAAAGAAGGTGAGEPKTETAKEVVRFGAKRGG